MKTYILIYKDFAQFEVVVASYFMKTKGEIITVGMDKNAVISSEGFKTVPDITIEEVKAEDVDIFIIPGGNPEELYSCEALYQLIKELNREAKILAGICAGTIHLAKAGVLSGKKYTTPMDLNEYQCFDKDFYEDLNVVVDDNIITAKATGYVDFAIEIGKVMDIYENEDDLKETVEFFKYFRSKI